MRVCFISHLADMTGAEISMMEHIDGLIARGVECRVVVPWPGRLVAELESRGVNHYVCQFPWWVDKQLQRGLKNRMGWDRFFVGLVLLYLGGRLLFSLAKKEAGRKVTSGESRIAGGKFGFSAIEYSYDGSIYGISTFWLYAIPRVNSRFASGK